MDTDGNKLFGFKVDEHHKFLRRTFYQGTVTVAGQPQELSLHNQGGRVDVTASGRAVELAQVGEKEDMILKLSVLEEGKEDAVAEVITDPGAKVIGGKLGGLEIFLQKQN